MGLLIKSFFPQNEKKSCLLSDKLPKTNHVPPVLYFIMMVLLLLYTPKTKKVFFTHIETKSKRNVFVLTEVPKDNYCKKTKQKAKKNLAKKIQMKYTQK